MNVLREFFLNNIGLKAISLLLAFLLWVQVASQERVQRTVTLPVELVNMPPQLEISNDYVKTVEAEIRSGRGSSSLDERELAVVIDLTSSSPGTEVIPLTDQNPQGFLARALRQIQLIGIFPTESTITTTVRNKPPGAEILRITPDRIRLQLERTLRKIVWVTPELLGEPAKGFEVSGVEVTPSEVVLSGPESTVQTVSEAKTDPINVEGLSSPLSLNLYLDLEDARLRIENISSVQVEVTIEEKRREVRIRGVAVVKVPEDSEASLMTGKVQVVGTVPISFKGSIGVEDLEARVNVEGLQPQTEPHEIVPEIELSEEYVGSFRVQSVDPERVQVRVR